MIKLIAAVDKDNGIGKEGKIPWNVPEDLKRFKKLTSGQTVVMGRNTAQSLNKPLSNRLNIVVSKEDGYRFSLTSTGATTIYVRSLDEALKIAGDDCWVIGGQSLYEQTIDLAHQIWLTTIEGKFDCDRFFPAIDYTKWDLIDYKSHTCRMSGLKVEYKRYDRVDNGVNESKGSSASASGS